MPFSYLEVGEAEGRTTLPFISPKTFICFLLDKAPELLNGGFTDPELGQENLKTFWRCYQQAYNHDMFLQPGAAQNSGTTVPVSLHGDEGRGRRRTNTCVIMLEVNLGLQTACETKKRIRPGDCDECFVSENFSKKCKTPAGYAPRIGGDNSLTSPARQVTNLRNNSFLSKFVLCVLGHTLSKQPGVLTTIVERLCHELRELATEGVCVNDKRWFCQLTGLKGDLDWYKKVANLTRCWKQQLSLQAPCCHECGAGGRDYPFEDFNHRPSWEATIGYERPWEIDPPLVSLVFSQSMPESVMRRDIFHNTKCGIFRDYIGGAVLLLCKFGYFNQGGESNKREVLLERAFGHFRLWCSATGKSPGLHSFTTLFFNAPNQNTYGWTNSKGSDTMLLISWLQVLVAGFQQDLKNPEHAETLRIMREGARHAKEFTHLTYNHGLWLPRHCASKLYAGIHLFLMSYNALAFLCLHKWQFTGFGMKTKFHMLAHAKLDIFQLLQDTTIQWVPNPQLFGCEMCEDVIGRVSRLSRRVSGQLLSARTLQLYLIKSKAVHKRFLKSLKS